MAAVLIVDDDDEIRAILILALEDAGHSVAEADNGQVALTYLQQTTTPHVVIFDSYMPVMDGDVFLQAAIYDTTLPAQHQFIHMTARTQRPKAAMETLLRTYHVSIITKPFDLDRFLEMVTMSAQYLTPIEPPDLPFAAQ